MHGSTYACAHVHTELRTLLKFLTENISKAVGAYLAMTCLKNQLPSLPFYSFFVQGPSSFGLCRLPCKPCDLLTCYSSIVTIHYRLSTVNNYHSASWVTWPCRTCFTLKRAHMPSSKVLLLNCFTTHGFVPVWILTFSPSVGGIINMACFRGNVSLLSSFVFCLVFLLCLS